MSNNEIIPRMRCLPAVWTHPFALGFFVWGVWMVYLSTTMLSEYTGAGAVTCGFTVLVLLGSLTTENQVYRLLPALLQSVLGRCLVGYTLYYQVAVRHMHWTLLVLLFIFPVVAYAKRLVSFYLKRKAMNPSA